MHLNVDSKSLDSLLCLCKTNQQTFLGKACDRTRTHWYTPPELLGVLFFACLRYDQSVFISKGRQFTKWQSDYQKFTVTVTQYQEVILEPLWDGQTMTKKWRNTNSTPPLASQCLGVWNETLVIIFSHEGLSQGIFHFRFTIESIWWESKQFQRKSEGIQHINKRWNW